jgi:undecaprenyl-phosphate 4-deoxy-4-formamido-L-arabinose transferase
MIEISIVIPVYNSEENLLELHLQITDALQKISHEIIFVNDCSKDNSWKVLRELAENNKNVTAVNLRKNSGQDNAIMAGFSLIKGNYVVIMDDDLQHSPYDIVTLYNKIKEGYDICYADFSRINQAAWKNLGSGINGFLANFLLKKPDGIYMSPFKIIYSEVIKAIIYNGPFPYVDGLILEISHNVTNVKVKHFKRYKGNSNYNFIKSITVFLKLFTGFSVLPLRMAAYAGFFVALGGFALGIYFIIQYFYGINPEGWTSLIVTVLILGGIMLMSIGLLGEYLGRIYLTVNSKPQYSIREIVKKE